MNIASLLSVSSSTLALILAVCLFFGGNSNIRLQSSVQTQQDEIQSKQQALQLEQQKLQAQQQQIESAAQLAQQTGPAVLRDLAELQVQNNNLKIRELLKKHGLEVTGAANNSDKTNP